MTLRLRALHTLLLALLAGAGLLVACNSGGGGEEGPRISDPALVPTATPVLEPLTFRLRNDQIEITAGGSTNPGTSGQEPRTHTVAANETCQEIADLYDITLDALLRANRGIDEGCTNLREGEILRIPSPPVTPGVGPGTPTPRPSGDEYVVESGDTCADIAAAFGVSADDIIALNGLDADCATLQPGDVLQIP
jgi:LysM repeat protein